MWIIRVGFFAISSSFLQDAVLCLLCSRGTRSQTSFVPITQKIKREKNSLQYTHLRRAPPHFPIFCLIHISYVSYFYLRRWPLRRGGTTHFVPDYDPSSSIGSINTVSGRDNGNESEDDDSEHHGGPRGDEALAPLHSGVAHGPEGGRSTGAKLWKKAATAVWGEDGTNCGCKLCRESARTARYVCVYTSTRYTYNILYTYISHICVCVRWRRVRGVGGGWGSSRCSTISA